MKKQLIAVGLAGLLTIPAVSIGAEMAGPSLYGSFRTGLTFGGGGDESVGDIGSRWGIKGSHEVAEGLTAAYKYEAKINTTNAESSGGGDEGGPGGRLSNISISGGFGSITLGQIWSASAIHYGFAVDGSYWNGIFGGASGRQGNTISYSSSAGDVTFQIDKVTGDDGKYELGASANIGPVAVGLGHWGNDDDDETFTGVALTTGAAGVNLTIGLGSQDDVDGEAWEANIVRIAGAVGDTGLSYSVQLSSADIPAQDKNLVILTNSLGAGASLIFEHNDPSGDADSSSLIALKVDF